MYDYNLILLNHFRGYPELIDNVSNDIRYAKLLKVIDIFDPKNTIFFSSNDYHQDKRLQSIRKIARTEGFEWIEYDNDEIIEEILGKCNHNFGSAEKSTVIIGGTNTAGCLLKNSNVAVDKWLKKGFNVQICLSICADYQLDGINSVEKNNMAMDILYNFIKDNNVINKVDVCYDVIHLRR